MCRFHTASQASENHLELEQCGSRTAARPDFGGQFPNATTMIRLDELRRPKDPWLASIPRLFLHDDSQARLRESQDEKFFRPELPATGQLRNHARIIFRLTKAAAWITYFCISIYLSLCVAVVAFLIRVISWPLLAVGSELVSCVTDTLMGGFGCLRTGCEAVGCTLVTHENQDDDGGFGAVVKFTARVVTAPFFLVALLVGATWRVSVDNCLACWEFYRTARSQYSSAPSGRPPSHRSPENPPRSPENAAFPSSQQNWNHDGWDGDGMGSPEKLPPPPKVLHPPRKPCCESCCFSNQHSSYAF